MNMFMLQTRPQWGFLVGAGAIALPIAVLVAGLSAPVLVDLLSWDSSPTLRKSQGVDIFRMVLFVASIASLLGVWVGSLTALDGRPLPGWRAARWGAAVAAAFLLRKGTHGKA